MCTGCLGLFICDGGGLLSHSYNCSCCHCYKWIEGTWVCCSSWLKNGLQRHKLSWSILLHWDKKMGSISCTSWTERMCVCLFPSKKSEWMNRYTWKPIVKKPFMKRPRSSSSLSTPTCVQRRILETITIVAKKKFHVQWIHAHFFLS